MRRGVAMPVVSASVMAVAPCARSRSASIATSPAAMSPSYGEPKAHEMTASTGTPCRAASRQMRPICSTESSMVIFTLRWL